MPFLCGPKNSRYTYTGTSCPHLDLALRSNAQFLGQAIREYEARFHVKVTPMLEPFDGNPENSGKYFDFKDMDTGESLPVDIHIFRDNDEICPKQDLLFALTPDDIVELGELVC